MAYFPLFVNIEEYHCLVAGGGSVAYRKAAALANYGAHIFVVAPEFCQEFHTIAANTSIYLNQRKLTDQDLEAADLVIAATDDRSLNHHISNWCRSQRIPVNVADSREESSFIFPALIRDGEITVGISTGGASPVIAQCVKHRLEQALPSHAQEAAAQLSAWRPYVKAAVEDGTIRAAVFHDLADLVMEHGEALSQDIVDHVIHRRCIAKTETED